MSSPTIKPEDLRLIDQLLEAEDFTKLNAFIVKHECITQLALKEYCEDRLRR